MATHAQIEAEVKQQYAKSFTRMAKFMELKKITKIIIFYLFAPLFMLGGVLGLFLDNPRLSNFVLLSVISCLIGYFIVTGFDIKIKAEKNLQKQIENRVDVKL
jgi:hypothetical protein